MQKDYREYTVGELLDMGLKIEVNNHNTRKEEEAWKFLEQFEGVKKSSHLVREGKPDEFKVVRGWRGDLRIDSYVHTKK